MIWFIFWCGILHYVLWETEWFLVQHCFPVIPVIILIKEIIGGPTFRSFMVPLIPGSIFRSNPLMVMVSSYS